MQEGAASSKSENAIGVRLTERIARQCQPDRLVVLELLPAVVPQPLLATNEDDLHPHTRPLPLDAKASPIIPALPVFILVQWHELATAGNSRKEPNSRSATRMPEQRPPPSWLTWLTTYVTTTKSPSCQHPWREHPHVKV